MAFLISMPADHLDSVYFIGDSGTLESFQTVIKDNALTERRKGGREKREGRKGKTKNVIYSS